MGNWVILYIFHYIVHSSEDFQNKLTLNQISLNTFSPPADVTLKLSDGSIAAHRMILAAVSPVFEKMFYGDFKDGKSTITDLPADNCKVFKLLIDFIYNGSCKMDCMDDTLPLLEVMDRYQLNKGAFYHMCGKVVLANVDSSNYLTLLPKFVAVLNEDSMRKAADKVMCYTNSDFIDKFDETKDLPEELLLLLLQRNDIANPEIDIFDFLIKWHDYQTKELQKTLKLVSQLFQSIRYFLIIPHLLLTKVVTCPFVDKHLLAKAIDHLYKGSPKANESSCKCGECNQSDMHSIGKPRSPNNIVTYWISNGNAKYLSDNTATVSISSNSAAVLHSQDLKNGSYVFSINIVIQHDDNLPSLTLNVCDHGEMHYNITMKKDKLTITLLVYDDDMYFKASDSAHVVSNFNTTGKGPFNISVTGRASIRTTLKIQSW